MSAPPPPPGPIDWARIDRKLCEAYHLTPPDVSELTLPEIAVLSMRGDNKGPPGGRSMSDSEMGEQIRLWRSMTDLQRLQAARLRRERGD